MKLALLGYGKMGRKIEEIALNRGHEIALRVDEDHLDWQLDGIDVAIDFSTPEVAFNHIAGCLKHGVPVVSGTTGWLDQWEEVIRICQQTQGAFLYASNFSLGVNLFFQLNRQLARLMNPHSDYEVSLEETHHIHKKDSPSGTAITLAEGAVEKLDRYSGWYRSEEEPGDPESLPIASIREGEVPGIHTVEYRSGVDRIRITHEALNRDGFALGAVIAAEWLPGRIGVFSVKDVLGL